MQTSKKVVRILTIGCENDDCFSWFHFINSYFIYGCFENEMRLTNYTKGKAGHVQASGSMSPSFGNSSKLERDISKVG